MKGILAAISITLILATHALGSDFLYHSDGPYRGKVIDLETGEPIEGAVVAGVWVLDFGFRMVCDAKEVLTNRSGEFTLPKAWCFDPSPFGGIGGKIIVFKPGYLGYPPLGATPEERESRWPGFESQEFFRDKNKYNIIRLGRPKTRWERENTLSDARGVLSFFYEPVEEPAKKLPILLKMMDEEKRNLGLPQRPDSQNSERKQKGK